MLLKLPYNQNQTQFTTDVLYRGVSIKESAKNKKVKNIIFEILSIAFLLTTIFYFFISYNQTKKEELTQEEKQMSLKERIKNETPLTVDEEMQVLNQELKEINNLQEDLVFPKVQGYFELD